MEEEKSGAISLMSRLTPICTIYGLLSTASGLGVRHTGPPNGRTVGSTVAEPSATSVQLGLYEPASSNRNAAYSRKKGQDRLYRTYGKLQKDEVLYYSYSV
jgi:hypothetical protein